MRPTPGYVAGGIDTPPILMCGICASTGRIVKGLYQAFDRLKLSMAREKKAIGKTSKGFDFLEYHVRPNKIDISTQSIKKFTGRILERLYQPKADFCQLFQYVRQLAEILRVGTE